MGEIRELERKGRSFAVEKRKDSQLGRGISGRKEDAEGKTGGQMEI